MLKLNAPLDILTLCAGLIVIAFLIRGAFLGIESVPIVIWLLAMTAVFIAFRKTLSR